MKAKALLIFILAAAFLLILIKPKEKKEFFPFTAENYDEITYLSVKNEKEDFSLEKKQKDWFFSDNTKADKKVVNFFLKSLYSAYAGNVLCQDDTCDDIFLTGDNAPSLILGFADKKTKIRIGKNSSSPFSSYIKEVSSGKVREVSGFCASMLPKKIDFVEKSPFLDKNPEKIKIKRAGKETDFFWEENEWFSYSSGLKKNFSKEIKKLLTIRVEKVFETQKDFNEGTITLYYKTQLPEEFFYNCQKDKIFLKTSGEFAFSLQLEKGRNSLFCQ